MCDTSSFVNGTAADVRILEFYDQHWTTYMECVAVIALYYVAAITTRIHLLQPSVSKRQRPSLAEESPRLPSEDDANAQTSALITSKSADVRANDPDQDICLSWNNNHMEKSLPGDAIPSHPPLHSSKRNPQTCQNRKNILRQFLTVLCGASHVLTLTAMMAWSITYTSWLSFVLLLWSCILCMMPNTRRACLRTSPALVAYAELLLLLQYVLSLNLTDTELPELPQVGLIKYYEKSYRALFVKMSCTVVFWITLYQYVDLRHRGYPSEILGVTKTLDDSASVPSQERNRRQSSFATAADAQQPVRRLANRMHRFFSRYWVWVPAISLGLVALVGSRVVVYRVVYLFFFLVFLLIFQLSYNLWVDMMYCFLMAVIIYTMMVLILIYTYQFERFPSYWEEYLHIPPDIQHDLGLEKYSTYDTFVALLVPTSILIITIWQLNWFHEDFLKANRETRTKQHRSEKHVAEDPCDIRSSNTNDFSGSSIGLFPRPISGFLRRRICTDRLRKFLNDAKEVSWRILEIHAYKIVFFSVTYVSVYDVVCKISLDCGKHYTGQTGQMKHQIMGYAYNFKTDTGT
ncbi:piezo-type mechanosensitive ion channel component-like [Ornithodoros turicata]|uniref:piezo-type mechanosensitive ion channel component-like n=1 Tax=Ornithodoros turicata TaxID=34597 RepID=UPI003139826D